MHDEATGQMDGAAERDARAKSIASQKASIAASLDELRRANRLSVAMFAVVSCPGKRGMEFRQIDVDQDDSTRRFDATLMESGLSVFTSEDTSYESFEDSLAIKDAVGVLLLDDVRRAQGSPSDSDGDSPILKLVADVRGSHEAYIAGSIPTLEKDEFGRVVGLVFAYSCESLDEPLYAYQKVQRSSVMQQSRFLYRIKGGSRFGLFTEESIKIVPSFDFLIVPDALLVLKPTTIEQQFAYQAVLQRNASVVVSQIEGLVAGAEVIGDKVAADRRRVVKKLLRIKSSPVMRMSASELRARLESEELYRGKFEFGPDDRVIVYDDNVESVLKMLDDELLRSPLTDTVYESEIKSQYAQSEGK